ncbi:hypothetical protein [Teichococcus wenyumeiae]|uniref:hypothetical protein n=1 Tax=Teichococcus wenyumeiae TaxID=2478470 RepID=UPI0011C3D955|nr:hypothetical protein [Pseudoroseomonas wenyumeiae]
MKEHAGKRVSVRQMIASLLRLAHADAQDARRLAQAGGTRNAARLLRDAATRLIEAVVASEQGYAGPPETSRIDARNPLKASLLRLDALPQDLPALRRDGRLAALPPAASVLEPLGDLSATLDRLAQHFGVDLDGSAPAATADPLRPEVQAPPPPPKPPETPGREPAQARRPPAKLSPSPEEKHDHRPRSRAGLSSGSFWSLADRWGLAAPDALALIGSDRGLSKSGARPRFKLTDSQAEILAAMRSLDAALGQLGLDPGPWLSAPLRPEPFRGARPLEVIRKRRLQGLRDVSRHLMQMSLRLSLQQA